MAPQLRCLTSFVHLGKIGTSLGLLLIAVKQHHWTHFRSAWGHLLALLLLRRVSAMKIANVTFCVCELWGLCSQWEFGQS